MKRDPGRERHAVVTSQTNASTWRIFCAFEIPDDVRALLTSHISELRQKVPASQASWTRVENIHLTLKFLGNVSTHLLGKLSAAAARAVDQQAPIKIHIGGTGAFPKVRQPRVLWVGINDWSGKLGELEQRLEIECEAEGFAKEQRVFRPHLTIARIRMPEGGRLLAETHQQTSFDAGEVTLTELIVFRSELSSKGSTYTPVSRHPL